MNAACTMPGRGHATLREAAEDMRRALESIARRCPSCGGTGVVALVGVLYECDAGTCSVARAAIAKAQDVLA